LAARRYPDVEIAVTLQTDDGEATWHYEIAFYQDNQRRAFVRSEKVRFNDKVLLDRPRPQDKEDPQQLTQTHLEQVNVNKDFRDVATFFATIRYLHIVPQLVREPDRSVGRVNDPFGGDLLEQVAKTPERTQKARLRRIQEALRVAVPQLHEIELWRDVRGTPHLRWKYQHWRPQGAWQTEEQFSDGTLRLMGLLWVALDREGPLLLEEPELSLHPEIVQRLPQMLARVQRRTGRQIFLSTHSPELLRDEGIGLDEVLLLQPTPEGTEVSPASSHQDIGDLLEGGLSLADAVIPRTKPQHAAQLTSFGES
jgi:predicted ATPase